MSDDKNKKPETDIQRTIREALQEAIPLAVVAGAQAVQQANQRVAPPAPLTGGQLSIRCTTCGQLQRACKDEHAKMVVYPSNIRRGKSFDGVYINGVRYCSSSPTDQVWVPKENNIKYMVAQWEEGEENLAHGRVVNHNSGTLSPYGSKTNEYQGAGFNNLITSQR